MSKLLLGTSLIFAIITIVLGLAVLSTYQSNNNSLVSVRSNENEKLIRYYFETANFSFEEDNTSLIISNRNGDFFTIEEYTNIIDVNNFTKNANVLLPRESCQYFGIDVLREPQTEIISFESSVCKESLEPQLTSI